MSGVQASPRDSSARSVQVIDLRRPFLAVRFISNEFGSMNLPLLTTVRHACRLGAKSLIVEDIETAECIEYENEEIRRYYPNYEMVGLRRLTFWKSFIPTDKPPKPISPRNFIGYAILKCDKGIESSKSWYIYESLLPSPKEHTAIIPQVNTFTATVMDQKVSVSGILYCGQDCMTKSCAHTTLRSLVCIALQRDISFHDISSIIDESGMQGSIGLNVQNIHSILETLGVEYRDVDYTNLTSDVAEVVNPDLLLLPSVTTGPGAMVGFQAKNGQGNHLAFLYGYTFDPTSIEYMMDIAYSTPSSPLFRTITPWISSYICTDDNFGAYYHIPRNSSLLVNPSYILVAESYQTELDPSIAQSIGSNYLLSLLEATPNTSSYWSRVIETALTHNSILFHPRLTTGTEYLAYICSTRDWCRNKVRQDVYETIAKALEPRLLWILEFTIPELVPDLLKLGEVVLNASKPFNAQQHSPDDVSHFVLARIPSQFVFHMDEVESPYFISTPSGLSDPTPLMKSGQARRYEMMSKFDYDVALSFAGEDRATVKQVAERLSNENIRVFYDIYERAALWGKDLYQHLQHIYRDSAQYCLVFVSVAYAKKLWTKHELKQAQARAFTQNEEYILPVRLDDTMLPGVNVTTGYFHLRPENLEELIALVIEKLEMN